jgi:hypothetical protein
LSTNGNNITAHVDLGEGDWADIRTSITYGDRVAVRSKLLGLRVDENGRVQNASRELDILAADLEGMRRFVVAWGGPTFCELHDHPHSGECQPIAITVDNISALPGEKGDRLAIAVAARGVTESPGFTTPPSPPSSTAAAAGSTVNGSTTSSSSESSNGAGTNS